MFSKSKEKANKAESSAPGDASPQPAAAPETAAPEVPAQDVAATAAEPSPAPAPEPPQTVAAEKELAALKDRYARLLADFDNYRKRQTREREDFIKRANEELLGDLLPVVDHLELALAKTPDPSDPFVVGVRLVYDQIVALLNRYGLTPIDAKGQLFNPEFHEALSQMTSPTVPVHVVMDQFRRGWLLAGRLLRPAQVIVSSGSPDPKQAEAESDSVSD
ncbi:MAG: nucleotide exchange factor GrpE [Kiritimatiellae bacterium]|nr:nucleotide exchange factor GrpE [Kiritimatiellia bacterium]